MAEAKKGISIKLGGNGPKLRREKSGGRNNRLKYEPVGYIRGKKVSGRRYYYYCEAVRQPDNSFKEVCEYLGTARAIRSAMARPREEKEA